jgi:O-antigen ligase
MMLTTGMLGALLICHDLAFSRTWRMRCWQVLCLTGTGMVLLGIAQRLTGAQAIYWNLSEYHGGFFFSVFRYHANAGAFINLVFPITAGLAARAILKKDPLGSVLWMTSFLVMVAASFVNVSRAAEAVTLVLLLMTTGCLARMFSGRSFISFLPWITVLLIILALFASSFGLKKNFARWKQGFPTSQLAGGSFFHRDRGLTYQSVLFHLLPRTGFWGSGPGTFEPAFAAVVKADSLPVKGRWDLAHNDYLQTLSEWGVIPSLSFLTLITGAIWQGFRLWRLPRGSSVSLFGICGAISLLGVLLHALVDFPLQIPSIQLIVAVVCGLLLGIPRSGPEEENPPNPSGNQRALEGGKRI